MNTLTPFGITARKLRLDKEMRLVDLAEKTKYSVAFISGVETGRKAIPDGYLRDVIQAMDLTVAEARELRAAADRTRKEIRVDKLGGEQRQLVAAFARRIDEVPPEMMEKLKALIFKSLSSEVPFQRKRRGILVPPLSTNALRDYAEKIRSVFVTDDQIEFPIMEVLEFKIVSILPEFYLDVQTHEVMGGDEGRMVVGKTGFALREDVYLGAWSGNKRDRFTACHEFAHFLLHRDVTMARARNDDDKIFCDSEWQADTFAGTLLMSPRHLSLFKTVEDAAEACRINPIAAQTMWSKYQREGRIPRPTQPGLFGQPSVAFGGANK